MKDFKERIMALPKIYQDYFAYLKRIKQASISTQKTYYKKLLVIERLIGKSLLTLNQTQIEDFFFNLTDAKDLSAATIRSYKAMMQSFYKFAVRNRLICEDPMPQELSIELDKPELQLYMGKHHLEVIQNHINEKIIDAKTRYENLQITRSGYAKKLRRYLAICLLMDTGNRVNEIIRITRKNIEFSDTLEGTTFVAAPTSKLRNGGYRTKTLPLDNATVDILREYLKVSSPDIKSGTERLINTSTESVQSWCRQLRQYLNNNGCPEIRELTPKTFRQIKGTALGCEVSTVAAQNWLGHKSINSMQNYFGPSREDKAAIHFKVFKPRTRLSECKTETAW